MASFGVTVDVAVDPSQAQQTFNELDAALQAAGLENFLLNTVVPFLRTRAQNRFASEGDAASGKWHPLTKASEGFRTAAGWPAAHPINVRTGQMKGSVLADSGRVSFGGGTATLNWPGTNRGGLLEKKIRTAQQGDARTTARPILAVDADDDIFIIAHLTSYLLA